MQTGHWLTTSPSPTRVCPLHCPLTSRLAKITLLSSSATAVIEQRDLPSRQRTQKARKRKVQRRMMTRPVNAADTWKSVMSSTKLKLRFSVVISPRASFFFPLISKHYTPVYCWAVHQSPSQPAALCRQVFSVPFLLSPFPRSLTQHLQELVHQPEAIFNSLLQFTKFNYCPLLSSLPLHCVPIFSLSLFFPLSLHFSTVSLHFAVDYLDLHLIFTRIFFKQRKAVCKQGKVTRIIFNSRVILLTLLQMRWIPLTIYSIADPRQAICLTFIIKEKGQKIRFDSASTHYLY